MEASSNSRPSKWKMRLIVCSIMLVLALVGALLMDVHSKGYWLYSQALCVIYALLSLFLYWQNNRSVRRHYRTSFWHQLCQWAGLLAILYIIDLFVRAGVLGNTNAGVVTMLLLAYTLYSVGLYSDFTLILIGLALAAFAVCYALIQSYLTLIMVPVIVVVALVIISVIFYDKRKANSHHV